MKRTLILALGLVVATLASPALAADDDGSDVYTTACASCHQADGLGVPGSFPPLRGNPNVADTAYVEDVVRNGLSGPIEVNGETYDGVMPPVAGLTDEQIAAVVDLVAGFAGDAPAETDATAPAPPAAGDAAAGESLFLGAVTFENGGPSCAACHSAGSIDQMGGPGLGPDLTDMFTRFGGEEGTASAIASPPSATMQPLFADHALTEAEVADLVAFFAEVEQEEGRSFDVFWLGGIGVLVVLLGAMALVAKRSNRGTYLESLRSAR